MQKTFFSNLNTPVDAKYVFHKITAAAADKKD